MQSQNKIEYVLFSSSKGYACGTVQGNKLCYLWTSNKAAAKKYGSRTTAIKHMELAAANGTDDVGMMPVF